MPGFATSTAVLNLPFCLARILACEVEFDVAVRRGRATPAFDVAFLARVSANGYCVITILT